jgi:hypothetical protein
MKIDETLRIFEKAWWLARCERPEQAEQVERASGTGAG